MIMENNYNPDVLSCLANLSNDEVFTSPALANQILDMLPKDLWVNQNAKFLDPVSKTGIFLREIAKRLIIGLEKQIPNKQERINHIYKNQLYGIAISELTSLLSRRSLYCSKHANGKYSVCDSFNDEKGNILYNKVKHVWYGENCKFCGASKSVYNRGEELETHAYQFIHTVKPDKIFNMKFDVIIGNPPYQLRDAGAQESATPIYNKFVEQAKKLNPRYLTMIIPARWYSGGKGLDDFRRSMLNDDRISEIHDFPDTSDVFPGLNIRGGICYFLWDKFHKGKCKIITHKDGSIGKAVERPLLEPGTEVFIRYNEAIPIFNKIRSKKEKSFSTIVSSRKPFGLPTNFNQFKKNKTLQESILLHRFGNNGYIKQEQIKSNFNWVNMYKVLVPYASPGDDSYPHLILSKPIVVGPQTACTETYLVIGPCNSIDIAKNISSYMKTRFVRFMILLNKSAQHVTRDTYNFVPIQDFNEFWSDEKLYKKYGIINEEIKFIESIIRPMT